MERLSIPLDEDTQLIFTNVMTTLREISKGAAEIDGRSIAEAAGGDLEELRSLFGIEVKPDSN